MRRTPYVTLTRHFYAALFRSSGSQATAVRGLAAVATPTLMAAFWLVNLAHNLQPWAAAGLRYVFVLYPFCAMGCITTLQWDGFFPDRADFLILLPLPIRQSTLFLAKLSAVGMYNLLFLFAATCFGVLLLPALSPGHVARTMLAHGVAVLAAGAAAFLSVLAFEGAVIVLTPERWYRRVAPVAQALLIGGFLTLFLRLFTVSERLSLLLGGSIHGAAWFPPLWFQALYEVLLGGLTATTFAHRLAHVGALSFPALLLATSVIYPTAWLRRHRMALEGTRSARLRDGRVWSVVAHRTLLRSPDQRAVFHFTRKTLSRMSRYHVLLALFAGAGLALASAGVVEVDAHGGALHWSLWPSGVRAAMPILLFWIVAGLRVAFTLPEDLASRWIFRMSALETARVITTVKRLMAGVCAVVIALTVLLLAMCHWSGNDLLVQAVLNTLYAVLLIDLFFFLEFSIPFTRPGMPEQTNLPLTLAVFLFGIPVCILLMLTLEHWIGHSMVRLCLCGIAAGAIHAATHYLRSLPSHPVSSDAFLGETDTDVQTLGLSA